jgi:hypothetical protein
MSEERIVAALRALAESDRETEAAPKVEVRVLRAFRRRRVWRRGVAWTAVAAALVVAALLWKSEHSRQVPAPVVTEVQAVPQTAIPRVADPVVSKPRRNAAPRLPREVVTDFYPLVDVAPLFERGELVRVDLPAAALRTVGLPVAEGHLADRVQADVLLGEEGLPRAIRFVKFQQ